jgi:hypothetical protein
MKKRMRNSGLILLIELKGIAIWTCNHSTIFLEKVLYITIYPLNRCNHNEKLQAIDKKVTISMSVEPFKFF